MNINNNTEQAGGFNLVDHVTYDDNSVVSKTLLKKETGTIKLFSFDKGQRLSEHTAPFDVVVQILDGESQITIGGQLQIVKTGEMIVIPANVPHALFAEQRFKMLLVRIRSN